MSADDEFRHESVQDRRSIVQYLRALTAGIEKGHIQLGMHDQELDLEPSGLLEFQIRAKRKGGRVKLALKMAWREDDGLDPSNDALTIKVDG